MRAKSLVAVAAACLLAACAGASKRGHSDHANRTSLSYEQLSGTNSENLYDAIEKLRPDWLSSRGPTSVTNPAPTVVSVFMNGTMLGKADYLREMHVLDVSEVRFWDAGQATVRFGNGHPRGVIELMRR
jgi:hypothetical protein